MKRAIDFGKLAERRWTQSLKYDRYMRKDGTYPSNLLPLWIADTDFETCPAIVDALKERVEHKLFGYHQNNQDDRQVLANYLRKSFSYEVDANNITILPGLLPAMSVVSRMAFEDQGAVLTHTPVYPPFMQLPRAHGASLLTSPLVLRNRKYTFDFEHMRDVVLSFEGRVSWFFLCNPHNPTGRAFSRDELLELSDFCQEFGINVLSDEVHCDLIWKEGVSHTPFATIHPSNSVLSLYGPGKTFNITGLGSSFCVVEGDLRNRFLKGKRGFVPDLNLFGSIALRTAYESKECFDYREQIRAYLRSNYELLEKALKPLNLLQHDMEATFLAFIRTRQLVVEGNPTNYILENKELALNDGVFFGENEVYQDYSRLNFATPRKRLEDALNRLVSLQENR